MKRTSSKNDASQADGSADDLEDLYVQAVRQRAKNYLRLPGVTSVGVGYRFKTDPKTGKATQTRELCIQYSVASKKPVTALEASQVLPKSIPFENIEIPVDVVQRSYRTSHRLIKGPEPESARDIRRERRNPVQPGISVSHQDGSAGTLGAIVFDSESGEPFVLSNWHVLHTPEGKIGDVIVQPGPFDDPNVEHNVMGRLVRSYLGLAGDCAIASIDNRRFDQEVLELKTKPLHMAKAQLDDRVVKSGRTTGTTHGIVIRVGVITSLNYGGATGVQQIGGFEIGPDPDFPAAHGEISEGGDSGSLWIIYSEDPEEQGVVVGLHFAGETDPHPSLENAVACNIHSVMDQLKVQFDDPLSSPENAADARTVRSLMRVIADLNQRLAALESRKCSCGGHATGDAAVAKDQRSAEGLGLPVYGNWCGPGHGGDGPPIDAIDRACMVHDQCYDSRGYFNCDCDQELIRSLDQTLASGQLGFRARLAGSAIRNWFARVQPCRK